MQSVSLKKPVLESKRARQRVPDVALLPDHDVGESVEAFLRRGGVIEQLDVGACGQPVARTFRAIKEAPSKAKKRAR